jgi:hypothetical protein
MLLDRTNDRRLPSDYQGDVLIWDIDKTYLDTRFSSWRGLLAIPFELAIDKEALPGSVPLLRALRRGPAERPMLVPLYFVSGSPPQLRRVIERKMVLDGVDFDGITFKDQLGLLKSGRVRSITHQVGYKLQALLLYRKEIPDRARWLLFGDDVEADHEIFGLFTRICAGLRGSDLERALAEHGVDEAERSSVIELASQLAITPDSTEGIFIHLTRGSDPSRFERNGTIAARSFLQSALVLADRGKILPAAISAVARDLRTRHVPEATIEAHLGEAKERFGVRPELTDLARR